MKSPMKLAKKFKALDITSADVAFVAYGKTLSELFANAALAMFDVMINTSQVKEKREVSISLSGIDLNSMMFNWLNKLLLFVDSESLAFSRFEVSIDQKKMNLAATCFGEKISEKMETRTEVKAATYHKMSIKKGSNGIWKARVILDI